MFILCVMYSKSYSSIPFSLYVHIVLLWYIQYHQLSYYDDISRQCEGLTAGRLHFPIRGLHIYRNIIESSVMDVSTRSPPAHLQHNICKHM